MRARFLILLVKLSFALFPRRWLCSKDIRRRVSPGFTPIAAPPLPLPDDEDSGLERRSMVAVGPAVMARGRRRPMLSLSMAMSIVPEDSRGEAQDGELDRKGTGGGGGGVLRCWSSGRMGGWL